MAEPWTHTWVWSKRPVDRNRKGQRCRVLSLVAAGASGPVVVRALEPGAHQMSAVVDLAVAVLESDAATSTHKGLAAR